MPKAITQEEFATATGYDDSSPVTTERAWFSHDKFFGVIMADGRFGCEADMAGPAAGSTRSLVTQMRHRTLISLRRILQRHARRRQRREHNDAALFVRYSRIQRSSG